MKRAPVLLLTLVLALTAFSRRRVEQEGSSRGIPGRARNRCRCHARSGRTAIPQQIAGGCHAARQKFPPRAMATVLRHMRARHHYT